VLAHDDLLTTSGTRGLGPALTLQPGIAKASESGYPFVHGERTARLHLG